MWCTITPSCALHVMLKGDFGTWCTHHKWNPKFDLLHDYFMLQTKLAVHGEKSYGTPWLCTHPCPKFEVIWIMLGELMANKYQIGFERHDRLTSYLNFDSGLLIDKDCLFTFIIFHGQYLTHIWHKWRFQKILSMQFWISYEIWKVWSNYGWPEYLEWMKLLG